MNFNIINSGSDGNCLIIEEKILLDCGVSFKKIKDYYKKLDIVFLTHKHSDHFNKSTIKKLADERPTLRFACCEWLVKMLIECGVQKKNIDILEIGKRYDYRKFVVIPIKLYHDVPQCGYKLKINGNKIIYATDTRQIEHIVAKDYDYYFIEGNYENEEELHQRAIDNYYENRVKNTHLSKVQATEWLMKNMGENSKYIFMHEHKERNKEMEEELMVQQDPELADKIHEEMMLGLM